MPTILIVDDSQTVRMQLSNWLVQAGFVVLEASNGSIGLDLASKHAINLIVTDLHMPVMTGLDMLEALRKVPGKDTVPALILTTESSKTAVERGRRCGATAWVVKPISQDTLVRGIHHILKLNRV